MTLRLRNHHMFERSYAIHVLPQLASGRRMLKQRMKGLKHRRGVGHRRDRLFPDTCILHSPLYTA